MVFGGEGLFLATIRVTGKVWLQSMPIRKLIRALAPYGSNRVKRHGQYWGTFWNVSDQVKSKPEIYAGTS